MAKVSLESIDKVCEECLSAAGVPAPSIEIITDTIHFANRRGVATHGVGRLPLYIKKIRSGFFEAEDKTELLMDKGALALFDAHHGFGQVASFHAMELAIKKAKEYGMAAVGVRNSNNFGMAGYFGDMAARAGFAAQIYANAAPAIAPTGGSKAIFGTNPLCYAYPAGEGEEPIVLDMATTIAARGKIRLAAKNGEKIPSDWAVDANGNPTDDPNEALKGTLLPIGGYKGYGLSLFVDLFAGLMTGSAAAGEVKPLSDMGAYSNNGHLFILMDAKAFCSEEELKAQVAAFRKAVKECGTEGAVLLPGERGNAKMKINTDDVEISDKQFAEINALAEELGIASRLEKGV